MADRVVIGTRGSRLALWQANWVKEALSTRYTRLEVAIEIIRTTGDRLANAPLDQIGGKEVWTREIEEALLKGDIDLAVHSLKDLPTAQPEGLVLGVVSAREEVRDVLISRKGDTLDTLSPESRIGTGSLRRQAQILAHRPDLIVEGIRGNVDTRLRKLVEEGLDAIVLAAAGLRRLGYEERITEMLDSEVLLPSPGQRTLPWAPL